MNKETKIDRTTINEFIEFQRINFLITRLEDSLLKRVAIPKRKLQQP